ncbi:DUF3324 domain-containing protein [Chryseobacterium sp. Leaf394]|uniref:WxL protein host-binding domain-containing protein n=1 Tax=Chryseobacterium sp. Leaf394 TaxID=1736361 RepID=UPI0006FB4B07|nr:DUF3324 domain-containing protein [Chryseobacterium sp. Leaf394]KQS94368.1 hypothetical protein ASG21_19280 [Chryseobacterium sp. Leaf394]
MIKQFLVFIFFAVSLQCAKAGIVVLNGLTHSYKVEKGQVYKGSIEIENTGSAPQDVKVFFQDLSYNADGNIFYTAPATVKRSNSSWVKINTNLLTLKGKEKTTIRYEIAVPKNLSESGSYWSAIMVEPVDKINPLDNRPGVNISSIVRYAIQIITDFDSENAKPELKFESVKIESEGALKTLKIAVANNGNLFCKPKVTAEIYDRNGVKVGDFTSMVMGLLPGTSKMFPIDISKINPGNYSAVILATDEDENAFALNVSLEVKND